METRGRRGGEEGLQGIDGAQRCICIAGDYGRWWKRARIGDSHERFLHEGEGIGVRLVCHLEHRASHDKDVIRRPDHELFVCINTDGPTHELVDGLSRRFAII